MSSADSTAHGDTWRRRETQLAAFESACQRGERPDLAQFLDGEVADRNELLTELVLLDLEYRLKAGEEVRVEEYCKRFPELQANRDALLEALAVEYRLRRKQAVDVTIAEYRDRFPDHADELSSLAARRAEELEQRTGSWSGNTRAPLEVPSGVPGYEIIDLLGRGGMGVVYRAWQQRLRRVVALKMIPAGRNASRAELHRFRIEAEAVARLQHPNVVQIHDIGEHVGQPYFTMEFIGGGSLAKRLAVDGALPPVEAARLVEQLARAAHHAHERGIVHRDLNPANVLLAGSLVPGGLVAGEASEPQRPATGHQTPGTRHQTTIPKLSDFGLAKLVVGGEVTQTQAGEILGTPSYMAPEQAAGKHQLVGPRTDVYGLGAILYACLTGRPPFRGTTPLETVQLVIDQEPKPPRELAPECPRDLQTICLKSLHKEPHRRYASAEDLAEDLRRFLDHKPIAARPVRTSERMLLWGRRNRTLAATILVAVIAMLVTASAGLWQVFAERERLRQERDRAEANLYKALMSDASAQLKARDTDWWRKAMDSIAAAAKLDVANRDTAALRELAIECLGTQYPSLSFHKVCLGHTQVVLTQCFSPDDRLLASGSADRSVRLWSVPDGRSLAVLQEHERPVTSVLFFGPRKLVSTGGDGKVCYWNVANPSAPTLERTIKLEGGAIMASVLSADQKSLIAGCQDGVIRIQPLEGDGPVQELHGHTDYIRALSLTVVGNRLASSAQDGTIRIWDLGTQQSIVTHQHEKPPNTMVWATSHSVIFTNIEVFGFFVLNIGAQNHVTEVPLGQPLSSSVRQVAHAPGIGWAATCGDGSTRLWESRRTNESREMAIGRGDFDAASSVAASSDSHWLAAGYAGGEIRLWERASLKARGLHHTNTACAAFVGTRRRLFNYQMDIDMTSSVQNPVQAFAGTLTPDRHSGYVWGVAASGDGRWLASCDHHGHVKLWDAATNKLARDLAGHQGLAWSIAFSSDSQRLASGAGDVKVWDVNSGEELHTFDLPRARTGQRLLARSIAFHPTKPWLTVAVQDGSIHLWNWQSGESLGLLHQLPSPADAFSVAFSPDGRSLAAGRSDNHVAVWDLGEDLGTLPRAPDHQLAAHKSMVWAVAYSPDGRWLASGGDEGIIILWDTRTWTRIVTLRGGTRQIRTLGFSGDGGLLAGAAHLAPIIVWELPVLRSTLREMNLDWED